MLELIRGSDESKSGHYIYVNPRIRFKSIQGFAYVNLGVGLKLIQANSCKKIWGLYSSKSMGLIKVNPRIRLKLIRGLD